MANGPVDAATMLQMQGAMEAERGFARAWSAGASETVKAAYMESAAQKGLIAAQNIRNRYYKKEFEQILETRVKPIQRKLQAAKEARDRRMSITTMPINITTTQSEQRQHAADQNAVQTPQATKEAAKPPEAISQQSGGTGAILTKQAENTEVQEALALVDLISGKPVLLNSPRGISLWKEAENNFWGEYASANQQLMEVMSEYQGNPYADKYAESLINNVIKQSNTATTGRPDPAAAQEWMENRQQFEAEQEARQQGNIAGRLALETKEAKLKVDVRDAARTLQADPTFVNLIGKPIADKLERGQSLTRPEEFEAASAIKTYRDLQEKEIAQRAKRKWFTISPAHFEYPELWQGDMRTQDSLYKQYYGEEYADLVNNQYNAILNLPREMRRELLETHGAEPQEILLFEEGSHKAGPSVLAAFEAMANTKEISIMANDAATLRRLPELEKDQPEVANIITQTIEDAISQMKAQGLPVNEDLLRTDRYRAFLELTLGREVPETYDEFTERNVDRLVEAQKAQQGTIVQPKEETPIQKYGERLIPPEAKEVIEPVERKVGLAKELTTEPFSWASKPIFSMTRKKTEPSPEEEGKVKVGRSGLAKKLSSRPFSWVSKRIAE